MKRLIAEWLWRAAVICALVWIGWELHQMREEMLLPVDEQTSAETAPYELQRSVDALSDHVAALNAKVDAIMIALTRLAR